MLESMLKPQAQTRPKNRLTKIPTHRPTIIIDISRVD
jgi:hypothetical protein